MTTVLYLLQGVLILATAPLMVGLVRAFKSRFQNRRGASPLLPYTALLSLLRKEMTITHRSSWVFRFVPFAVVSAALVLAFMVPTFMTGLIPLALSNVFVVGAVMTLASAFLVMGGMDTASTFGNMGASREMTLAALVEPALYVSLATIAVATGTWSLDAALAHLSGTPWHLGVLPLSFTLVALLFVTLAENARYPVDNPATHLELTMVHEAMVLEYSGPYLALLEYASAVKMVVLALFLTALVLPFGLTYEGPVSIIIALAWFVGRFALAAFFIALIESTTVKMRFYRMQEYFSLALSIALAGFAIVLMHFFI